MVLQGIFLIVDFILTESVPVALIRLTYNFMFCLNAAFLRDYYIKPHIMDKALPSALESPFYLHRDPFLTSLWR